MRWSQMRNSLAITALLLMVAAWTNVYAADVIIGDFEGTTLSDGWKDWGFNGPHEFANSTTGATHGSQSIKITPGTLGYAQSLTFKLQDLPNREEAYQGYISNTHVAYDVTWDPADWNYLGEGWNGGRMFLTYNEQGSGWNPPFGINPDANGFTQPNLDTGNPTNQGFWDIGNYPNLHTRTMMWDYSHLLPSLTSNATDGWLEMIIDNELRSFQWPASIYIDNVRFTTPAVAEPMPGDFNLSGIVDAADYTIWRNNLNAVDDSALNGNGDGVPGVGPGDYTVWKTNFVGAGGGSLGAGTVPEPAAWLLAMVALGARVSRVGTTSRVAAPSHLANLPSTASIDGQNSAGVLTIYA